MNQITAPEITRLKQLEKIIKAGEKTFIEVGLALTEIRDDKLYRAEHGSFEKYMDRAWGWSKQHGYRIIEAAHVAKAIPEVKSQNAANALAKVPPPRRQNVVEKIVETGKKVTAAAIKAVSKPPTRPAKTILDGTGLEVPKEALTVWNRMPEAQNLLSKVSDIRGALKSAQDNEDKLFAEVDFTDCLAKLNQVYIDLQRAKPFAVCPSCSGIDSEGCMTCYERGLVSEFYWKHNVAQETKDLTGRK